MAIVNKAALTAVFETGDTPQGSDFASMIDSAYNLAETGTQSSAGSMSLAGALSAVGISSSTSLSIGVQNLAGVGTAQGTAAVMSSALVIGTTGASDYAFILPNTVGAVTFFINTSATTASIFPPVGSNIDSTGVDTAVSVATGNKALYICQSATQYRSFAV